MFLRRYIFLLLLLIVPCVGFSQTPFNGMIIEEVVIHPDTALMIQTQAGFTILPRTWRFYVCLNDPYWELQVIFGYVFGVENFPLELDPGTANFFQSPFGAANGLRYDNSVLEAFFPFHKYDSWFTIGNNPSPGLAQNFTLNELTTQFEPSGNGFLVDDGFGGGIFPSSIYPPIGMPDNEGRILVGQFTLEGLFTGTLNFSFRKLNPDSTIFDPDGPGPQTNLLEIVGGISIDNTPGLMDAICSIQFLPIDLVQFNAIAAEKRVNLSWETRSEENNDYFTVERSSNLVDWVEVAHLDGSGTTSATHFYYTIDRSPLLGTNYYRLKQTDFNGASETFEVKSVYFKGGQALQLYPNPANSVVKILGPVEEYVRLDIFNSYGNRIDSFDKNALTQQLDLAGLSAGIYFLEFTDHSGQTETHRLIVQQ
jgi:hypothetical protein